MKKMSLKKRVLQATFLLFALFAGEKSMGQALWDDGENVGIGIMEEGYPKAKLDVRGTFDYGTCYFKGSQYGSHFNFGDNENSFLRGGKTSSHVFINDAPFFKGNVGIGILSIQNTPSAKLDVGRGTNDDAPGGTAMFRGTTHITHINCGTDENTYIRGGINGSHVIINETSGLGNVGIGMYPTSGAKLDIKGDVFLPVDNSLWIGHKGDKAGGRLRLHYSSGYGDAYIDYQENLHFRSGGTTTERIFFSADGKIGIGTTSFPSASNSNRLLYVGGGIITTQVEIQNVNEWKDCVFAKDYQLKSLQEVEQFISKNKHLPDVPSESQVKKEGIDVAKMDATLLQKVEELTLYLIEQNKKLEAQNARIEQLEKENAKLKK